MGVNMNNIKFRHTVYIYKEQVYGTIAEIRYQLGPLISIPDDVSEESLSRLGVTVEVRDYPLGVAKTSLKGYMKAQRDLEEVAPIMYNEHLYDYDSKARERINAAIIALELQGPDATIIWTSYDNEDTILSGNDLKMIVAAVASRSDLLHRKYREKVVAIDNATTVEELELIKWSDI